jgi:ABC-type uncharacterized transport system permease subunit
LLDSFGRGLSIAAAVLHGSLLVGVGAGVLVGWLVGFLLGLDAMEFLMEHWPLDGA